MDYIIFNQPGGFPLRTNTLEHLQKFHKDKINGLGAMAGTRAILNGCEESGNKVSAGNIQIDGEMYGLIEGIKQDYITIKEDKQEYEFENGENKVTVIFRYAVFGTGANSYKWSDFKRVIPLNTITEKLATKAENTRIDALEKRIASLEKVNAPELAPDSGSLKFWGKPWSQSMTPGWVPATEFNNRILRGSSNPGYNIGSDTVQITTNHLPSITGSIDVVQPYEGDEQIAGSIGGGGGKWFKKKFWFNLLGGGSPLTILPACRTVLFLKQSGT